MKVGQCDGTTVFPMGDAICAIYSGRLSPVLAI